MKEKTLPSNQDLFYSLSVFLEKMYLFTPLTAKVQAYMILESDEDGFTFEQLREVFQVSKSSLSNSLNFLLNNKQLEYYNKIDSRKRYFRLNLNWFIEKIEFLDDMFTQEINLTRQIEQYKILNNTISESCNKDLVNVYLAHLEQSKNLMTDTINKINKIQLDDKL